MLVRVWWTAAAERGLRERGNLECEGGSTEGREGWGRGWRWLQAQQVQWAGRMVGLILEGRGGGEGGGWWVLVVVWWLFVWLSLGWYVVVLWGWGVAALGELGCWAVLGGGDERGELEANLDGLVWVADDRRGVGGSEASILGLVSSRGRFAAAACSGRGFLLVPHW